MKEQSLATTPLQDTLALIGRMLVAWLFVPEGWSKITGFQGTVGYIASAGVPMPEVAAALAIVAEFGLGLALLVGFKARWAAAGLAIFVAVITPVFHHYWNMPEAEEGLQAIMFHKNLAILGGLLALTALGAGGFSIDGRRRAG